MQIRISTWLILALLLFGALTGYALENDYTDCRDLAQRWQVDTDYSVFEATCFVIDGGRRIPWDEYNTTR